MPALPRRPWAPRLSGHFIVCGQDDLTFSLAEELAKSLEENVVIVMSERGDRERAERINPKRVKVVITGRIDQSALAKANVDEAYALALVNSDDIGNIHAALTARDMNPRLRLVVRVFNTRLGERIRSLITDLVVISDADRAAPAFVNAALGDSAQHIRLAGQHLRVSRRADATGEIVCALADTSDGPTLLPNDPENADLVLEKVPDQTNDRPRGQPVMSRLFSRRLILALTAALVLLVAGTVLYSALAHMAWTTAIYVAFLTAAGTADIQPVSGTDTLASGPVKVLQLVVTVLGMAVIPIVTAAVVDTVVRNRLRLPRPPGRRLRDHMVVCGLGTVGTRVVELLHERGEAVVAVERDPAAPGVEVVRRLRIPLVQGDAGISDSLLRAGVERCKGVLAVTSDDFANLETAIASRSVCPDLGNVVVRMLDGKLTALAEQPPALATTRSVSRLVAPAFAMAMLERWSVATIAVRRRVLVVADIPVAAGSGLDGRPIEAANLRNDSRVICVVRRVPGGREQVFWSPDLRMVLRANDRLLVVATRAGLSHVLLRRAPTQLTPLTVESR